MTQRQCFKCSKSFLAKPSVIRSGNGKFCSWMCYLSSRDTRAEVKCGTCGKSVVRTGKESARSKSSKFFCTKKCQTIWRNSLYQGPQHANYTNGKSSYRNRLLRESKSKKCSRCGLDDERVLAVHHLDGNREHNEPANLAWLCHNCHFLIHHNECARSAYMATIV